MHRTMTMTTLTLTTLCMPLVADTPCEERVASNCVLSSIYPYNTVAKLFVEDPDTGSLGAYGTGFLVSPHCALTNGHCVYKRNKGRFFIKDIHLMPGACRGGSGWYESEFGTREAIRKHTNNKWTDTSYTPKRAVDYGALTFVCPFEEITTFMPLCFGYESDWSYMAGYPTEDTPDSSKNRNQWLAYGDMIETHDRWVRYDAHSTGGASGSPVWNWAWDTDELAEVFAINSTHWNDCDGGGPRLVWQNEDLIRDWMRWEPTLEERLDAGCLAWEILPWDGLVAFFEENPDRLLTNKEIVIGDPGSMAPPTGPSRKKMQVIELGFYEWYEYDLRPGDPTSPRMIQMISAPGAQFPGEAWFPGMNYDPEALGFLTPPQARILFSASAGRASKRSEGIEAASIQAEDLLLEPSEPDQIQDDRPDQEPDFVIDSDGPAPCPGDLDGDGKVDGADLGLLLGLWGTNDAGADLNGDGKVDGGDIGLLLGSFGDCP